VDIKTSNFAVEYNGRFAQEYCNPTTLAGWRSRTVPEKNVPGSVDIGDLGQYQFNSSLHYDDIFFSFYELGWLTIKLRGSHMYQSFAQRITLLTVLSLSLLITGCYEYVADPVEEIPQQNDKFLAKFTGKVYQIGSISGPLAEEMAIAFNFTPYSDGLTDGPIVLSGETLGTLTDAQRTGLAGTYAANQPILLFHATADQINALRQVLGVTISTFVMPEGMERVEVYALDHEPDHEIWQYTQYPPQQGEANPDDSTDQQWRVSDLIDWMDDNQARKTLAEHETTSALPTAKETEGNQLTQLASAFVDQRNFSEEGNRYQLSHFIYSFHSVTTGEDWFYIQQQGIFNGSGAYKGRSRSFDPLGDEISGYMDSVDISTTVNKYAGNTSVVGLIQASPETANNVTEISTGISYDVGGEVSLDKKGPAASLSGGVSVKYSTKFNVRDCTTYNKSISEGNNAHWTYVFKKCDPAPVPIYYVIYGPLSDPPALSVGTFQPINQWIWRMTSEARITNPSMHVKLKVNRAKSNGAAIFWVPMATHTVLEGKLFEYDVALPLPPVNP